LAGSAAMKLNALRGGILRMNELSLCCPDTQ
jgi:hypothetical protein